MTANFQVDHLIQTTIDALWDDPKFPFCLGGQARLMKAGYKPKRAWETIMRCLSDFLKDNNIAFGDSGYLWGMDEGAQIVEEYELIG